VSTFTPQGNDVDREWFVVDAEGLVLGRLATEVASILRGKHKPTFSQHRDMGDHVIIVNAEKVVLTGAKAEQKRIWRHSGFPGGISSVSYAEALDRKPAEAVRRTIKGMIPKNRLGAQQLKKLQVYAGPTHPHGSQKPRQLDLPAAKARVSN
jgi:large subunit ribosomal protein L13